MFLKYIKMHDFRQYAGTQELILSNDAASIDVEKNVTIILGQNTAGKTTLLQAFKWCFYGITDFKNDYLLNSDKANKLQPGEYTDVKVEICLMHSGLEYTIYRKQAYYVSSKGKLQKDSMEVNVTYKDTSGQTIEIKTNQVRDTINEILPEDLSNYFFFDTERIGNISTKNDVSNAVKGLLGLTVLANAKDHLNKGEKQSVIGQLKSNIDTQGNLEATDAKNKLSQKKQELENLIEEIAHCNSEINRNEEIKDQLNETLSGLKSVAEDQEKIIDLEKKLSRMSKELTTKTQVFKNKYNKSILNIFAEPLINDVKNLLQDAKIDDKGIIDITSRTIDEIIERKKCICGTTFCEGDDHYKALLHEKSFVPPESLGTSINKFKIEMSNWESKASDGVEYLNELYSTIGSLKTNINDTEDDIESLSKKIHGKEDARHYEEKRTQVKNIINREREKLADKNQQKGVLEVNIDNLQKKYDSLIEIKGKNLEFLTYVAYAQEIFDRIEKTYSKRETEIRETLEEKVNSIFTEMYHGQRYLTIDEKYQVTLYNNGGAISTEASTGLETVKNFAFITGLVALAKEKIINKSDNCIDLQSEAYPLVMDAPFSNADEVHVKNIASLVPEVAEQVLIFVMEKDWQHAKKVMGHKVNKEYFLDKHSETLTFIKEKE